MRYRAVVESCWLSRERLALMGVLAGVCLGIAFLASSVAAKETPPNVILVMTDDQGYGDVGVHGNDVIKTPNLDRFAEQGVQMRRFYCSPVCAPTRACLMTGRYYYRTGVIHTSRGGAKMSGDEKTVAELFADAGYATGIFGKWHLGDTYPMRPQDQGFADSLYHKSGGIGQTPDRPNSYFSPQLWAGNRLTETDGYCTDVFFEAALEFIRNHRDRPFFVYLPTNAPHTPLEIADRYVSPYLEAGATEATARVYGMVQNIDENFGRLVDELEKLGLRDDTLVVFLTDNGPQQRRFTAGLRDGKGSVYEGGIRVPCFVQWPARFKGGRAVEQIAAHIDILPTLLDACEIQSGSGLELDGVSFLPSLCGDSAEKSSRWIMFQCHRGLAPQRYQNCAVMGQQFKAVANAGTFGNEDFVSPAEPSFELYEIEKDPGEQRDVAAQHPALVQRVRRAYDRWFNDVQSSRQFTPGLIQLGSAAENPTRLCRYQDGDYRNGRPYGWTVQFLHGGRYELTVNRGAQAGPGAIHVQWNGQSLRQPVNAKGSSAEFDLPAGRGKLDIWLQLDGQPRVVTTDNSTIGDVTVRRVAISD